MGYCLLKAVQSGKNILNISVTHSLCNGFSSVFFTQPGILGLCSHRIFALISDSQKAKTGSSSWRLVGLHVFISLFQQISNGVFTQNV